MATKKKKYKKTSIHSFVKIDKHYREIFRGAYLVDYKDLFEHLPKEKYLSKIFFNPKFVLNWSYLTGSNYNTCKERLDVLYSNFNAEDLYIYFKLNHQLNKHKELRQYMYSMYELINDLVVGYTNTNEDYLPTQPSTLVYGPIKHPKKFLSNIARDYCYYNFSILDLKKKYKFSNIDYLQKLKEIYQLELYPIDISQMSY